MLPKKPNILFMIADDHRHNAIQTMGDPTVQTPTLDKLIQDGTAFTQAYIMGSTSGAVCMPSRGMLLTGRSLFRFAEPDLGDYPLWPQLMQEAGYTTYGIGKWHNLPRSFARCFQGGRNIFFGGMSAHDAVPIHDFDATGAYPPENSYQGPGFSTNLFCDAAIDFINSYEDEAPFCLYLSFTAPHDPRTPPPEYAALYPAESMPVPENFAPEHPFDNGDMRLRDEQLAPWPRTPEIVQQHIADYYGLITHLDAQIGQVLAALKARGQVDNTIVVYTADHGLAVGQHGLFGKQNMYDHSLRVPLIIRGPNIPQNQRLDDFCYMPDLYPTLCDLAEISVPDTVESRSLLPLIQGDTDAQTPHRETIFSAYKTEQRMVREGNNKLIEYFVEGERETQLFDVDNDPWETNNLATDARHQTRVENLRQILSRWQKAVDDPLAE